jgi:hypothetical protein
MEKYGDAINRIVPELGPDIALFFQSHPDASTQGDNPPLPWTGLMVRCRDTAKVTAILRELLQAEVDKLSAKMKPEERPYLSTPKWIGEAEVTFLENLLEGVREPISPDFTLGFASWRGRMLLFTSKSFAFDALEALHGHKPALAKDPVFAGAEAKGQDRRNFSVFLDLHKIADAAAQPRYRAALAEMALPLDWDKINAEIRRKHRNLPIPEIPEFDRRQIEAKNRIKAERARMAVEIARNVGALKILRSASVSGIYLTDAADRPAGLHARLTLLLDAKQ